MRQCRRSGTWWAAGSAVVTAVFASGVLLMAGPPAGKEASRAASASGMGTTSRNLTERIRGGSGIPENLGLPVLPPITLDYRIDARFNGNMQSLNLAIDGKGREVASQVAGGCFNDYECDDCNPCTIDACHDQKCVGGDLDGLPCTEDTDCAGVCLGGDNPGADCTSDADCCGTDPTPNGVCDFFACGNLGSNQCINFNTEPAGFPSPECSDGLECNGGEYCDTAGGSPICVAGTDDVVCGGGSVCDEEIDSCAPACANNPDCSDGLNCNGAEVCDTGRCGPGTSPCGPGGENGCLEGSPPTCPMGRCCTAGGVCTVSNFAGCAGGIWVRTDDACAVIQNTDVINDCPDYAGGIAPQGTFVVEVGPVTAAACDLNSIGDDYHIAGLAAGFLDLHLLRFAANIDVGTRFAIELRDSQGRLIEDVFFPDGVNQAASFSFDPRLGGPAIISVDFDPAISIPADGIISVSVQPNFSPNGSFGWLSTTAPPDTGTNNDPGLYVDGSYVAGDVLGRCSGGWRANKWCDRRNGNTDCGTGGTCNNVADVLAFEIVGEEANAAPLAACCDGATGTCTNELPWVCEANGDNPQAGTFCRICQGGANNLNPCDDNGDCTGGDTCQDLAACLVRACCNNTTGACTERSGACVGGETDLGFGTSCSPDCCPQPTSTGHDNCLLEEASPSFIVLTVPITPGNTVTATRAGTNAAATYDDFTTLVCQGGVNIGDPCTVATQGVDCPGSTCAAICGIGILDPDGAQADPGWWQGFSIDKCADVRVDFCCSEPVIRPSWGFMTGGCPCVRFPGDAGVEPPIGIGPGTAGFGRGEPFCNEDNLWQTYNSLPPGKWFIPIYGASGGTTAAGSNGPGGPYTVHVTAAPCPTRACCSEVCSAGTRAGRPCNPAGLANCPAGECVSGLCVGGIFSGHACGVSGVTQCPGGTCGSATACSETSRLECETVGGYWLGEPNTPEGQEVTLCTGSPCAIGSCCDSSGCEDRSATVACDPLNPTTCMDETLCEGLPGTYVGGARCNFPITGQPCPVCPVAGASACFDGNSGWVFAPDRHNFSSRLVDDFVSQGTEIKTFCWGAQFSTGCGSTPPADAWIIRFYEDNGGIPGALLPNSPGLDPVAVTRKRSLNPPPGANNVWDYSVDFNPTIPVSPGGTYWVEISGAGRDGCIVYIPTSFDGNNWMYWDFDFDPPNVDSLAAEDHNTQMDLGGTEGFDVAFCVDTGAGIQGGQPRTGACCTCQGVCANDVEWQNCIGAFDIDDNAILLGTRVGNWFAGQTCAEITCAAYGGGGGCELSTTAGEDCENPIVVTDGVRPFSTRCSATDGPLRYPNCDNATLEPTGTVDIMNDLWFEYTATCTGVLSIGSCIDTDLDSVIAVYSNPNGTCPDTTECDPAPDPSKLVNTSCFDGGCQSGVVGSRFSIFNNAPGKCYKIRLGGYGDALGTGKLEVSCAETLCAESTAPLAQQIDSNPGAGTTLVASVKNRFLSFQGGSPGRSQGVKVTFVTLPAPWNIWNGREFWVQAPQNVCETSGIGIGGNCGTGTTFKLAGLQCEGAPGSTRSTAHFRDWSAEGVVHVRHPGFVPLGQYQVRLTDEQCLEGENTEFGPALSLTNPRWGDIGGNFDPSGGYYVAPDNSVGITTDVTAALNKFGNRPNSPIKVRADVEPCVLDAKINVTDVTRILDGFRNIPFPFAPTGGFGCTSTDPCSYTLSAEVASGQ